MEKRYQIFISSTFKDLIEERQKVTQAILKLYHFPIGMEMFHADNNEQWCQIKKTIDMSDYYVLIVGRYCGTLIEDEGISYTEKEYNYAISKGIPVLSFLISDDAKIKSYGVETNKQQKALKKFIQKVKKLPCEFWSTSDELAYKVSSTLSIKFRENNRNGWMQYNPYGIMLTENNNSFLVGSYVLLYFSQLKGDEKRFVKSKLILEQEGKAVFYNNVKKNIDDAEYVYHGLYFITDNVIYLFLKNDYSQEIATLYLAKFVGESSRFIGIITALSSTQIPISIKVACFGEELYENGINEQMLNDILTSSNVLWDNNVLIIEEKQRHMFFTDKILNIF